MSENKSSSSKSWISIGFIVVLCAMNLLLLKQNLDLRKKLAGGAKTVDLTTNFLQPGDVVEPITATDLDGQPYQLEYKKDGRHRLLLFFSPNCPYCEQQSPLWRDMLDNVDSNRFTVLGTLASEKTNSPFRRMQTAPAISKPRLACQLCSSTMYPLESTSSPPRPLHYLLTNSEESNMRG